MLLEIALICRRSCKLRLDELTLLLELANYIESEYISDKQ